MTQLTEASFLKYLRVWITQVNSPTDISETHEPSYTQSKTRQTFRNLNGSWRYPEKPYLILEVPIFSPIKSYFSKSLHQSAVSYLRLSSQLLRGTQTSHQRQLHTHSQRLQTEKATGDLRQTSAEGPQWGGLRVSLEGLNFLSVFRLCICSIKHTSLMLTPVCTLMVTIGPQ